MGTDDDGTARRSGDVGEIKAEHGDGGVMMNQHRAVVAPPAIIDDGWLYDVSYEKRRKSVDYRREERWRDTPSLSSLTQCLLAE